MTQPEVARYTDPRFRRVARKFDSLRLDQADAIELVAFMRLVPFEFCVWIFRWTKRGQSEALKIFEHQLYFDASQAMHEANQANLSVGAGLTILAAMQDGGWYRGRIPKVCEDALRELRSSGLSITRVAEMSRLSYAQVQWRTGRKDAAKRRALAVKTRQAIAFAL